MVMVQSCSGGRAGLGSAGLRQAAAVGCCARRGSVDQGSAVGSGHDDTKSGRLWARRQRSHRPAAMQELVARVYLRAQKWRGSDDTKMCSAEGLRVVVGPGLGGGGAQGTGAGHWRGLTAGAAQRNMNGME